MDTAPLPPVDPGHPDPDAPTERLAPVGSSRRRRPVTHPPSPVLRAWEVLAGLLSGGLLMVGAALLALQFLAPDLAPGVGLAAASGPGWPRVAVQLGAGVAGELAVLARRRCTPAVRWAVASAVIATAWGVLWWAWWA